MGNCCSKKKGKKQASLEVKDEEKNIDSPSKIDIDDSERQTAFINEENKEKERIEEERIEKERIEKERIEKERIEKERIEKERIEKERIEKERIEKERIEKERIEKERIEKEKIEKERIEKKNKTTFDELIERQKSLRNEKNKEPNENQMLNGLLEDMCVMGNLVEKQIEKEKLNEPEKFMTIEEATKNVYSDEFCLGVLSQAFEDKGMTTAIEKGSDESTQNSADTTLQFITNGMIDKKKYNLHFDLEEERSNELLNNLEEQKKFNEQLRKKLSLDFNIPEDKIIITFPQKGSYQVQVIFQGDEFNNLSDNAFRAKYRNESGYGELNKLKSLHSELIMKGVKLTKNMLDPRGNRESGWGDGEKRGGYIYHGPLGWRGYGLRVFDKYDNGNNDWLAMDGNPNEWAVAYHGIGIGGQAKTLEQSTNFIINGGFQAGSGQAHKDHADIKHKGRKVGVGVYCSPDPKVMDEYAKETTINGKRYKMGFMMRVKPSRIRTCKDQQNYWVLDGTINEMRPYRIMLKEV